MQTSRGNEVKVSCFAVATFPARRPRLSIIILIIPLFVHAGYTSACPRICIQSRAATGYASARLIRERAYARACESAFRVSAPIGTVLGNSIEDLQRRARTQQSLEGKGGKKSTSRPITGGEYQIVRMSGGEWENLVAFPDFLLT